MNAKDIVLGKKARDTISGLEGVLIAKTDWLNGCVRVLIQPREIKDGKPVEATCFDVEQIELVKDATTEPVGKRSGGPMPSPTRAADPSR